MTARTSFPTPCRCGRGPFPSGAGTSDWQHVRTQDLQCAPNGAETHRLWSDPATQPHDQRKRDLELHTFLEVGAGNTGGFGPRQAAQRRDQA